jgi:DNA-binding transcriptional ArsR family regulator
MLFAVHRSSRYDVAAVAELLAEPPRAAVMLALLDGTSRPATELARCARVAPATASEHLKRLVDGGMLVVRREGRHRYYSIASSEVAHAVEMLAALWPPRTRDDRSDALRVARMCYRHLAGRLGVEVTSALSRDGHVMTSAGAPALTETGAEWLVALGLANQGEQEALAKLVASPCLDWTERVFHWAGPLGITLAERFLAHGWVVRRTDTRALRITARGERGLREMGIRM